MFIKETGDLAYILITLWLIASIVASKMHNRWVIAKKKKNGKRARAIK